MKKEYHHHNLKEELLIKGLALLSDVGESQFSLRKLAAFCGVSHAAPYAHYSSKEDFLLNLRAFIIDQFLADLKATRKNVLNQETVLIEMGIAYIDFFITNDNYYDFLFQTSSNQQYVYSLQDFEPFQYFSKTAAHVLQYQGIQKSYVELNILAMWSLVHGLCYSYLHTDNKTENWKDNARLILNGFTFID